MSPESAHSLDAVLDYFKRFTEGFVLYGIGAFGKMIAQLLLDNHIIPTAICDQNSSFHGQDWKGIRILSPETAACEYGDSKTFIVVIKQYMNNTKGQKELSVFLQQKGCEKEVAFLPSWIGPWLNSYTMGNFLFSQSKSEGSFTSIILRGAFFSCNHDEPGLTVYNGERTTINTPASFKNKFYITGDSVAFSLGSRDEETIASYLQEQFNRHGKEFRIRNFGLANPFWRNILLRAMSFDLSPGDVLCILFVVRWAMPSKAALEDYLQVLQESLLATHRYCISKGCHCLVVATPNILVSPFARLNPSEQRIYNNEKEVQTGMEPLEIEETIISRLRSKMNVEGCPFFYLGPEFTNLLDGKQAMYLDRCHLSPRVNEQCAITIFNEYYLSKCASADITPAQSHANAMVDMKSKLRALYAVAGSSSIQQWLDGVPKPPNGRGENVGAVVMNCNPMTNGHLHLLKAALAIVDYLYLFVVEEDKSDISFRDRFRLVQECTTSLQDRVHVLPSGKYVLSSLTFDDYFGKEKNLLADEVDPSYDIAFFGSIIAPALGISHRFVGEEPTCLVTKKYNETMLSMLPPMGVEVHVIPRLADGDHIAVSASRIRAHWRTGTLPAIKDHVPETVYSFLLNGVAL